MNLVESFRKIGAAVISYFDLTKGMIPDAPKRRNRNTVAIKFARIPKTADQMSDRDVRLLIDACPAILDLGTKQQRSAIRINDYTIKELKQLICEAMDKRLIDAGLIPRFGKTPTKAHSTDAGLDIYSAETTTIMPGQTLAVRTGLISEISPGWYVDLRDRSSMGAAGITHFAGVIDSGYAGEWRVVLYNSTRQPYHINEGDRICQGVLMEVPYTIIEEEIELSYDSARGTGGFGSTGK